MASEDTCLIGEKIMVRGHISGQQNLVVEGRIEGNVTLDSAITVESSGVVEADVQVTLATVKGQVRGQLQASRQVTLLASCRVTGKVKSPQIVIEEGAHFSGEIEMDVELPSGVQVTAT